MTNVSRTLRVPEALYAEAEAYATATGVSFNALSLIALRDYLDHRALRGAGPAAGKSRSGPPAGSDLRSYVGGHRDAPADSVPGETVVPVFAVPRGGVYQPCPCRSGKKWKFCHGVAAG